MYKYHKRIRLFADSAASAPKWKRLGARIKEALCLVEPFLCFYAVCGIISFIAHFLLADACFRKAVFISMTVLAAVFTSAFILCGYAGKRRAEERRYLECLVFLFCKYKSFRSALREMQSLFAGREMKRVINQAQFIIDRGADQKEAMAAIEKRLSGRRVALLHRYISECGNIGRYRPPAEIITGLLTEGECEKRPPRFIRLDRMRLAFCSAVSFGISFALKRFAEDNGLMNKDIPADFLMALALVSLAVIFLVFELWCSDVLRADISCDPKALLYDWLRELIFFLLVKPVPEAIAISAVYADTRIRKKVSKLAVQAKEDGASYEAFMKMAEGCEDKKAERILEFLYAKSEESSFAPAELFPVIRLLDEHESARRAKAVLEAKKSRQGLLLSPQAASLVMVLGNFITLFISIGREL